MVLGLGLHNCHENAKCINTHGSFNCECKKGFTGDGRTICDKTCYERCAHGQCSGYPDYLCRCHLGWTGIDCSVNCGCNNHSTCNEAVGKCDSCQFNSEGEFCERCVPGSFGNATTDIGCMPCDCNKHENKSKGICDESTGQCFCEDNTEGMNCEYCSSDYYGDPSDGGQCFQQCESRLILKSHNQGLGSFQSKFRTKECLWMIKLDDQLELKDSIIQLEIGSNDMNLTCNNNAVYVYNGLPDFSGASHQQQLVSVLCKESSLPWRVESRTGQMTVYFKYGGGDEGFNAKYSVMSCSLSTCLPPYICDENQKCVCQERRTGLNCSLTICPNNCSAEKQQGLCDESYGRCICSENFGSDDCSKAIRPNDIALTELFNTELLSESFQHLKKTLPRFGHTLIFDRRSLWMIFGFSLSHGALNDIRQFDVRNNTWMQVSIHLLSVIYFIIF